MMRSSAVVAIALLVLSGVPFRASAAPTRFAGSGLGREINFDIEGGNYPAKRVTLKPNQHFDFSVEPATSSIVFNKVVFDVDPFTTILSEDFLVPGSFTERRTITTTLAFNKLVIETTNLGPLALQNNVGTQ
jgi:hypothetical protein